MRESKAKNRILEVANTMFKKVGYSELNVNEIAHEAGVSIGTLYYHFPKGKISILMDMREQIAGNYKKRFQGKLNLEHLNTVTSVNDGFKLLIKTLIDIHREERHVLAAMESEVLSNLVSYDQVTESINVENLIESDVTPVSEVLKTLNNKFPQEVLNLDGRETIANKIIDILIHRFVYVESIFGSEDDFINIMTKIAHALLK